MSKGPTGHGAPEPIPACQARSVEAAPAGTSKNEISSVLSYRRQAGQAQATPEALQTPQTFPQMPPQGDGCLGGLAALPLFPRRGQKEGPARKPPEGRAGMVRGQGGVQSQRAGSAAGLPCLLPTLLLRWNLPGVIFAREQESRPPLSSVHSPGPTHSGLAHACQEGEARKRRDQKRGSWPGSPPGGRGPSRNLKRTRSWQGFPRPAGPGDRKSVV